MFNCGSEPVKVGKFAEMSYTTSRWTRPSGTTGVRHGLQRRGGLLCDPIPGVLVLALAEGALSTGRGGHGPQGE